MSNLFISPTAISVSRTRQASAATRRLQTRFGFEILFQVRGNLLTLKGARPRHSPAQVAQVLKRANEQMALMVQEQVLIELERGRIQSRRQVSTGRLAWALGNRRNIVIRPWAFGVGVPSWLDRSRAKYWRQIDKGTTVHLGNRFFGVWGASATNKWSGGRTGRWMVPGGPYTPNSGARNGKFMPTRMANDRRSNVYRTLAMQQREALEAKPMVIENPIEAQEFFKRAYRATNIRELAVRALRGAILEVIGESPGVDLNSLEGISRYL